MVPMPKQSVAKGNMAKPYTTPTLRRIALVPSCSGIIRSAARPLINASFDSNAWRSNKLARTLTVCKSTKTRSAVAQNSNKHMCR